MKKAIFILAAVILGYTLNVSAVDKQQKSGQKSTTEQVKKKDAAAPADKVVPGKKGPDGQTVYEGPKGGQYYISKGGNKTYLKPDDNVVAGKKGPDGQPVYTGPKGGQYYINKKGDKVYLSPDKK